MIHRARFSALVSILMVLACSACTAGSDPSASAGQDEKQTVAPTDPTESAASEPALRRPKVGDCYLIEPIDYKLDRDETSAIPCSRRHTSETFLVVNLADVTELPAISAVGAMCDKAFAKYAGDSWRGTTLSWKVMVTSGGSPDALPTWARCDIIEPASLGAESGAPRTGSVRGTLEDGIPVQLVLCTSNWPPTKVASCRKPHKALALDTRVKLGAKKDRYPGKAALDAKARAGCVAAVDKIGLSSELTTAFTIQVGALYPKKSSWQGGHRYATCWILSGSGKLPPLRGTTSRGGATV